PISPRNESSAGPSSAASSTNTSGPPKRPGHGYRHSSGTPQASRRCCSLWRGGHTCEPGNRLGLAPLGRCEMKYYMPTILIYGAAGFVGTAFSSHLTREQADRVVLADRRPIPDPVYQ